jgi:Hsp70 protein
MMCPNCGLWEIRDGDNYCSWCPHKFISLDLTLEPRRFVQTELPPPAVLTVAANRSAQNEIVIHSISANEAWVTVDLGDVHLPLTLPPGQRRMISIEVDPLDLDEDYASASIIVESNAGRESVDLEVVPAPEVRITTGEYEIFLDNRELEQTYARVEVTNGVIEVCGVAAEPAEWVSVRLVDPAEVPVALDARGRNSMEVKLVVDEGYLLKLADSYPAVYEGKLILQCADLRREEAFRVRCWKPPDLWVWEESDPRVDAYAGKPGELTVSVQNKRPGDPSSGQGNAMLEIRGIEARNADGSLSEWLRLAEPWTGSVRIEGGGLHQFRLIFDTVIDNTADGVLGPGRHRVNILLDTNMYEGVYSVRFEIDVRKMPVYEGVLALDFGTSNTCCAILGRREDQFVLLPIDANGEHPTTTPTVIQYCDIAPNGVKQLEIGAIVDARSFEPRVANASVRSPKRKLGYRGEDDKFEVCFYFNSERRERYLAREVVADYLGKVRAVAEEHGRALFKRITVTHPARFRLAQLRDLEEAVRQAFGADCEITTLQEPIAAALDFIVSAQALQADSYVLGVFDFGGGTTDLSVLEVSNIRQNAFIEIRARLVSSTGQWFGGEDLTKFVFNYGLARCRAVARQRRPEAEIVVDARPNLDPSRRLQARANNDLLLRWAELSKLLLVNHGDDHILDLPHVPGLFPCLKLNVFAPARVEEMDFPHEDIVPRQVDLYAALEVKVTELGQVLRSLAMQNTGRERLDYILLSGKSSAIPRVREVLAREFSNSEVRLAAEPKECVVSGACILEKFQDAADMFLNIEGTAATTSRVGIESVAPGGSKVFQAWIEAGVPIPGGGLVAQHPMLLNARKEIRLLENDGTENALWIMGKENPNISELGTFVIESPPSWLPARGAMPGIVVMRVSQNLEYTLSGQVDSHEEVLRFVSRLAMVAAGV